MAEKDIIEIPNFEDLPKLPRVSNGIPTPPNSEAQDDEKENIAKCKECKGEGGWDEEMMDYGDGEEFWGWVICDKCDGTGEVSA